MNKLITPKQNLTEKKETSQIVYSGSFFNVHKDTVLLPNQKTSTREYIRHPGAVIILPVLENGKVIVERQFRYPLNRVFLEFPAGKLDPGEDPFTCAKRELVEETGYHAKTWQYVCTIHNAIGYSDEELHMYLAKDLEKGQTHLDEEEFIETISLSLDELLKAVQNGDITDVKTVIGSFWLEKIFAGAWKLTDIC